MSGKHLKQSVKLGCFLFGFLLPFLFLALLICYFFVFAKDNTAGAYGVLFALTYGCYVCAAIGLALGVAAVFLLPRTKYAESARKAGFVMLIVEPLLVLASLGYGMIRNEVVQSTRAYQASAERDEKTGDWERVYGGKYPKTETSLPAVFGPYYYPKSRLADWQAVVSNYPIWSITCETSDPIDSVVDYYMSVIPGGLTAISDSVLQEGQWFSAESAGELRSADHRITRVSLDVNNGKLTIQLRTYGDPNLAQLPYKSPDELPAPWPPVEAIKAEAAQKQAKYLALQEESLGDLLYPRAKFVWGSVAATNVTGLEYATTDSLETVVAHYRARFEPQKSSREGVTRFVQTFPNGFGRTIKVFVRGGRTRVHFRDGQ